MAQAESGGLMVSDNKKISLFADKRIDEAKTSICGMTKTVKAAPSHETKVSCCYGA
jgi:hypothetical protein